MKYFLPELEAGLKTKRDLYFCKDRPRYATATDIFCLDDERIIVASLIGKKIYLLKTKESGLDIIHELNTQKPIDLFDFKDNLIVSANAYNDGISIFKLEDNQIHHIKTVNILKNIRVHGVHIIDHDKIIIASNNHVTNSGIYFYSIGKEEVYKYIKSDYKAKDIIIHNEKLIVLASESFPISKPTYSTKTHLQIYNLNTSELINQVTFEGQADAISIYKQNLFVTIQDADAVFIYKIQDDEITFVKSIDGFSFPHGIHINLGKMFVTNYGDNSIQIFDVEKILE